MTTDTSIGLAGGAASGAAAAVISGVVEGEVITLGLCERACVGIITQAVGGRVGRHGIIAALPAFYLKEF
jgi:hypothetical protein